MNELEALEGANSRKVLLGVSGGIASAVAAALLKNQGHEVLGVYLDIGAEKPEDRAFVDAATRCGGTSFERASAVAKRLDIPLSRIDVRGLFEDRVLDRFIHDRLVGRQGSPCLRCHSEVKLAALFSRADELGIDKVATGHYVQVIRDVTSGEIRMHKGVDPAVDQSQLLYALDQDHLKRLILPLGGIPYSMVARLAAEFELEDASASAIAEGACLGARKGLAELVERRVAPSLRPSGTIKTPEGQSVGEHDGLFGFELGRRPDVQLIVADPDKYVVVDIDPESNSVTVSSRDRIEHRIFLASGVNWLHPMDRLRDLRCRARVEGAPQEVDCRVTHFENSVVHVELAEARVVGAGRTVAFYAGTELLGGARIDRIFADETAPSRGGA